MSLCEAELPAGIKPLHYFWFGLFVGFGLLIWFVLLCYGEEEITSTDVYFTQTQESEVLVGINSPAPDQAEHQQCSQAPRTCPGSSGLCLAWCVCECWKIPCTSSPCFNHGPLRCHSFCTFCFPHISPFFSFSEREL